MLSRSERARMTKLRAGIPFTVSTRSSNGDPGPVSCATACSYGIGAVVILVAGLLASRLFLGHALRQRRRVAGGERVDRQARIHAQAGRHDGTVEDTEVFHMVMTAVRVHH